MSEDSDNSSIINECELFVAETASFDRIFHNIDVDPEPNTIIFHAGSPVDRAESLEDLKNFVMSLGKSEEEEINKKMKLKQGSFMGFLTQKQIQKEVLIPGQFATYYLVEDVMDSLDPPHDSTISLNLQVCYLNSRLRYRHYPIVKRTMTHSTRIFYQLAHFDSSKISNEPIFTSIKSLLTHYTQFVYVDSITETGGLCVEVFPK